jgi:hypothetical protein
VQSSVTEHAFLSIKILITNGTGNRIVAGFLVAFLIIGTGEFFSADVAGIGVAVILYLRHWNTIQTQENSGNRVQDRYNFTLNDIASSTFPEMVHHIFRQQTSAFKINVFYFEKRRN